MSEAEPTALAEAREELLHAFEDYEAALMRNEVALLDDFFEDGPASIRSDAGGVLRGHEAISAFRASRGGVKPRIIGTRHVEMLDADTGLIVSVSEFASGGRGTQTQLWSRRSGRWRMRVAHVTAPAPALDRSVWRAVGSPLVDPLPAAADAAPGALAGETVAVKDMFAVAGWAIGAGNPAYLAEAAVRRHHAAAVSALLGAGAAVTGIASTDEFAYSIAGRNVHFGTPPNPAAPGTIPGGSTSGPATAVALGQVSIGLGTDTAGSVRVPASYQGLWGVRTTHGTVSLEGVLPLAPTFDTVGWLTRDARLLGRVTSASLDITGQKPLAPLGEAPRILYSSALTALAEPSAQEAFHRAVDALVASGRLAAPEELDLGDVAEYGALFRAIQPVEAWESDGEWVSEHWDELAPDVRERFEIAHHASPEAATTARARLAELRARLAEQLDGAVLLVPSASSAAPRLGAEAEELQRIRVSTLAITSVAGIGGLPAVSAPLAWVRSAAETSGEAADARTGAPLGLCFVGPRFTDLALIDFAGRLAEGSGRL